MVIQINTKQYIIQNGKGSTYTCVLYIISIETFKFSTFKLSNSTNILCLCNMYEKREMPK